MTTVWGDNVVPLFKSLEDLQREEREIWDDYLREWAEAGRRNEVAKAAISNEEDALAKSAASEKKLSDLTVTDVRALVDKLAEIGRAKARIDSQKSTAMLEFAGGLLAARQKLSKRLFGHSALSRRSLRFASARRPHDPTGGAA